VRAVVLGAGGLGCPAALALCEGAASLGLALTLRLVDDDRVERSNLARQILFREQDTGALKVDAACERLRALCPQAFAGPQPVALEPVAARFDAETAGRLLGGADVLLDGTDSFETRFLANDRALAARVPLVHGAVLQWTGQLLTVLPGGPCLRCLFEGPPLPGAVPACAQAGVASPLCGLVGAEMAAEALRLLSGAPASAAGRLRRWESLRGRARAVAIPRDPACPACGLQQRPVAARPDLVHG
jgi:adenylyltransferase/sulfurtransferase